MGRKKIERICRVCGAVQDQPHVAGWCRTHLLEHKSRRKRERKAELAERGGPPPRRSGRLADLFPGVDHSREWAGIPLCDLACRQRKCGIRSFGDDADQYSLYGTGRVTTGGKI